MLPTTLETLVAFFGRLRVQDIDPSIWTDLSRHLPPGVRTTSTGQYLETRIQRAFVAVPAEAYAFLETVKHLEQRNEYAASLVKYDEWWAGFRSKTAIAKLMYAAEQYDLVNQLFLRNTERDSDLRTELSIWFDAISRMGNYNFTSLLATPSTRNDLISYLRYCWQKGDFLKCKEICAALDAATLSYEEKGRYLNNKIRVLRDTGRIKESRDALEAYANLIVQLREQGADLAFIQARTATYKYNVAIDEFIAGRLRRCLVLCQESLVERQDQYPRIYLLLRMARASILIGNRDQTDIYLEEAEHSPKDDWAHSILNSVRAEREFFLRRDTAAARALWQKGLQDEQALGSAFYYNNLGLALCAVADGSLSSVTHYKELMAEAEIIDGQICYAFLTIAEKLLSTNDTIDRDAVGRIFVKFKSYSTWLFFWFFALALLLKRQGREHAWVSGTEAQFLDLDYDLSLLEKIEMTRAPTVFISYSYDSKSHKTWCLRLYKRLRENGVDAILDQAYRGTTTIDFNSFMLKGIRNSDLIIVVLTPNYKSKIKSEAGGASVEFGLLRDEILRKEYKRIIFLLREGDFSSTAPFEVRGVEQFDFRKEELDWKEASEAFLTLLHRVFRIPIFEPVPIGSTPRLRPKPE